MPIDIEQEVRSALVAALKDSEGRNLIRQVVDEAMGRGLPAVPSEETPAPAPTLLTTEQLAKKLSTSRSVFYRVLKVYPDLEKLKVGTKWPAEAVIRKWEEYRERANSDDQ